MAIKAANFSLPSFQSPLFRSEGEGVYTAKGTLWAKEILLPPLPLVSFSSAFAPR